jgi:hypothetical protein
MSTAVSPTLSTGESAIEKRTTVGLLSFSRAVELTVICSDGLDAFSLKELAFSLKELVRREQDSEDEIEVC